MSRLAEQFTILSKLANNPNLEDKTYSLINYTIRELICREWGIEEAVDEGDPSAVIGFHMESIKESEAEEDE